jgi:hypothetical protein
VFKININIDEFIHKTHLGDGMKSLIDKSYNSVLVQVFTLTYDRNFRKLVYGVFNILVFMGVGVTVWYRFIPG